MPSVKDWQDSILREVGAGLEGLPDIVLAAVLDKVTPYLPIYWEMYARYAAVYPGLQALYVKKHCLGVLMGQVRDLVQVNIGSASVNQGSLMDALNKLYQNTITEIKDQEMKAQAGRPPVLGNLSNNVQMDNYGRIYRRNTGHPGVPGNFPWNV